MNQLRNTEPSDICSAWARQGLVNDTSCSFQGNEAGDGQGHVGNAGHNAGGEHTLPGGFHGGGGHGGGGGHDGGGYR